MAVCIAIMERMDSTNSDSSSHSSSSAEVDLEYESSPFDSEPESTGSTSEVHTFMYEPIATDRGPEVESDSSEEVSPRLLNSDW